MPTAGENTQPRESAQEAPSFQARAKLESAFQELKSDEKRPPQPESIDFGVVSDKELRRDLDAQLQKLKSLPSSRERSLSITKLQECIMWLGMDLKRLNDTRPYPSSYDPSTTKVEPTADGLKL